jgi:hypothetical protein
MPTHTAGVDPKLSTNACVPLVCYSFLPLRIVAGYSEPFLLHLLGSQDYHMNYYRWYWLPVSCWHGSVDFVRIGESLL